MHYWKQLREQSLPLIVMIIVYLYLYTIGRTSKGKLCSFNCSKLFQCIDQTHHCKVKICKFKFKFSLRNSVTLIPQKVDPFALLIF